MTKVLPEIDVVIEVTDARIPLSSENPTLTQTLSDTPRIKILNKGDLADPGIVEQWQDYFDRQRNIKSLVVSADAPEKAMLLPELALRQLRGKPKKATARAMIVGIPNVGKSSIINVLARKAIAKTGNEPAVTKAQQYIHVSDDFFLLDTPGVLWPKQEYEASSYRLAVTGAIKDTVIDYPDLAFFAAEYLSSAYPERLIERYELKSLPGDIVELLEVIGKKRGCLAAGGRVDFERVSKILITEIRSGKLGGLCFETPEMIFKERNS